MDEVEDLKKAVKLKDERIQKLRLSHNELIFEIESQEHREHLLKKDQSRLQQKVESYESFIVSCEKVIRDLK